MLLPLKNTSSEKYKYITVSDDGNFLYTIYDSTILRYDTIPKKIGITHTPAKWFNYNKIITNSTGTILIVYNNSSENNEEVQILLSLDSGVTWNSLKDEVQRISYIDCFFKPQVNLPDKIVDDIIIINDEIYISIDGKFYKYVVNDLDFSNVSFTEIYDFESSFPIPKRFKFIYANDNFIATLHTYNKYKNTHTYDIYISDDFGITWIYNSTLLSENKTITSSNNNVIISFYDKTIDSTILYPLLLDDGTLQPYENKQLYGKIEYVNIITTSNIKCVILYSYEKNKKIGIIENFFTVIPLEKFFTYNNNVDVDVFKEKINDVIDIDVSKDTNDIYIILNDKIYLYDYKTIDIPNLIN